MSCCGEPRWKCGSKIRPILLASERYPLYLPLTVRSLARSLGIQPTPTQRELLQQQLASA